MTLLRRGLALCLLVAGPAAPSAARGLPSEDFLKMRSAGDVAMAPDGTHVAYTVERNDRPARPVKQVFVMTLADGKVQRVGGDGDTGSDPLWSPDGRWLAFKGSVAGKEGLHLVRPDGGGAALPGGGPGHEQPPHLRGPLPRLVARLRAGRLRLRNPRTRDGGGHGRSRGDHALPLQAGLLGGEHTLQRQPATPHLPGRSRRSRAPRAHFGRPTKSTPSTGRRTATRSSASRTASPIRTSSTTRTSSRCE